MKKETRYLPVFLALICVYFYDVFLKGSLLAVEDGIAYHYPMMITMAKQYRNFIFPFWNPFEYSGFPLLAAIEPGALYPFNIVLPLIFNPPLAFNINIMLHYVLAGFFTFLYTRQIGLGVFASIISGAAFSLLGYLPAHLNHLSVIASGTWIPLLLYMYERMKQSLNAKYALYAAIIIALQIFAGHPQISFYTHLLLLFYSTFTLFYLESAKRLRFGLLYVLSVASGFLLALPQIVATYELATLGLRAKAAYEFFSSYPFPVHMLPTFIFPYFYHVGGSPDGEMWGPTPNLGEEAFIGTLPLLLSLLVMLRWRRNPHIFFWGIVSIISLVLALGDAVRPLSRLLYHLPIYNAFRAPSKLMILVSFALSVLAGFGISFLKDRENEKRFPLQLLIVLLTVVLTSLVTFTVFQGAMRDFFADIFSNMQHQQLRWNRFGIPDRALSITDASIYKPVIILSVYAACILAFIKTKGKRIRTFSLVGIVLLIFIEAISWKMTGIPPKEDVVNYNKDLYSMLAPTLDGRTLFMTDKVPPLTAMPYGIHLSDGYESLETEDYSRMFPRMYLQPPGTWQFLLENNSLLSMMNVRYLVVDHVIRNLEDIKWHLVQGDKGKIMPVPPGAKKPVDATYTQIYRKISTFPHFSLYENTLSLPRAYSVLMIKTIGTIDDLIQQLASYRINPWAAAIVSPEDLEEIGAERFSQGTVSFTEDRPDRITITSDFEGRGFVVLADQFYPGWEAYIDGKQTRIYKTNGVLRGVVVPEGKHEIVFSYVPRLIFASMIFSGLTLTVILFILIAGNRLQNREKARQTL